MELQHRLVLLHMKILTTLDILQKTSILDISLTRTFSAVPMHPLWSYDGIFNFSFQYLVKKNNYLFLVFSILIPVGMHGLYNFSLSSDLISHEIANVILFYLF